MVIDKKYLPSKEFTARLIILAILFIVIFGIYEITMYFKNRSQRGGETPLIVKNIVQKDSNNNGIADWEESLWGLDPTKNGQANKELILAKQQTLAQNTNATQIGASGTSAENELLAKQFFAVIMSLQQSGNLTDNSMQSVVDTVGNQVKATPLPDTYTTAMIKAIPNTDTSMTSYKAALKALFLRYQDKNIGDELSFMAAALKNNDPQAVQATVDVGYAYEAFAKELVHLPTPTTILPTILTLANDYDKTGQSLIGLSTILTDPILGMRSLMNYQKYNTDLLNKLDTVSDF